PLVGVLAILHTFLLGLAKEIVFQECLFQQVILVSKLVSTSAHENHQTLSLDDFQKVGFYEHKIQSIKSTDEYRQISMMDSLCTKKK
ncbi:15143_t:CDS:2, partial [Cetraspora pellucida]